jgi:hypothetical protein
LRIDGTALTNRTKGKYVTAAKWLFPRFHRNPDGKVHASAALAAT